MKSSLRWFALAACATFVIAGCKKNEVVDANAARADGANPPTQEQGEQAPGVTGAAPAPTDPPAPSSPATTGSPAITASATAPAADQAAYEAWFKKNKLDLTDPKMLDADPIRER